MGGLCGRVPVCPPSLLRGFPLGALGSPPVLHSFPNIILFVPLPSIIFVPLPSIIYSNERASNAVSSPGGGRTGPGLQGRMGPMGRQKWQEARSGPLRALA